MQRSLGIRAISCKVHSALASKDVVGWDSLRQVKIILALEAKFAIRLVALAQRKRSAPTSPAPNMATQLISATCSGTAARKGRNRRPAASLALFIVAEYILW